MSHLQFGPMYARRDYAGFIRRTVALGLDFLLLPVLTIVPPLAHDLFMSEIPLSDRELLWWWGVSLLLWILYMLGFRMLERGTLGYRIMRIRYQSVVDGRPALLMRLYRSTLAFVFIWLFLWDHIWILFDERKQAWHDKMSGFYVVKCGALPVGTVAVQQRVINFMGLTLFVWEPVAELSSADQGSEAAA